MLSAKAIANNSASTVSVGSYLRISEIGMRNYTVLRSLTRQNLKSKNRVSGTMSWQGKRHHGSVQNRSTVMAPMASMPSITAPSVRLPSTSQLKALFVASAVPMIGFGFMDNFIMIQAGGYIDATFGATLGLATLSAAAMGQVVSDVSGTIFGGAVERFLERLDLVRSPALSATQRQLPLCKNVAMAGSVAGIVVGCLLGATSLMFVDLDSHEREVRFSETRSVIMALLEQQQQQQHGDVTGCQKCTLFLLPTARFSGLVSKDCNSIQSLGKEYASAFRCADQQATIVEEDETQSLVFVPVLTPEGDSVGVLRLESSATSNFSSEDELTAHVTARCLGAIVGKLV